MPLILGILLVVVVIFAIGFIIHVLWIVAVIALVLWLLGFVFRAAEGESRRRWYRW